MLHDKGLLNQFYDNFMHCFEEIFNYIYKTDQSVKDYIDTDVEMRFHYLFNNTFKFISRIEFSKRDLGHIHFATNTYIPYLYQKGIFKQGYFNNSKKYHKDWQAAEPIAIYLTKNYRDKEIFDKKMTEARAISKSFNSESNKINQLHKSKGIILEIERPNILYKKDPDRPEYSPSPNCYYNRISDMVKKLKRFEKNLLFVKQKNTASIKLELSKIYHLKEEIAKESKSFFLDEIVRFQGRFAPLPTVSAGASLVSTTNEQSSFILSLFSGQQSLFLTGSAGTGKSTCISNIIKMLDLTNKQNPLKVLCCSFTGKAVQRIRDLIQLICPERLGYVIFKTIHGAMYSKFEANNGIDKFSYHEGNRSDYDLVIVDEASQLNYLLCAQLLNGLKDSCRIVFIGDPKQLKPINGISVLEYAKNVPDRHYYLTINHRSTDKINQIAYGFDGHYNSDIFKIVRDGYEEIIHLATDENYTVVTSSKQLAELINRRVTKNFPITGRKGYHYKIGMPVMFLKNDNYRGIQNGQIGIIEDYNPITRIFTFEQGVQISLDESLEMFVPGYALTCHKAQGSEYDKVIVLLDTNELLLTPELAYTAVTRAKTELKLFKINGVNEKLLYTGNIQCTNTHSKKYAYIDLGDCYFQVEIYD